MGSIASKLYDIARQAGKMAGKVNDVETLMSGDVKKMARRMVNKQVYKATNKVATKFRLK